VRALGEKTVRGTERNVIVWDCYWVLVGAGGEIAARGTERNVIVWDWNWVLT